MLVLVVEDEVLIGMMLEVDLERAGCRVIGPASNYEAALRLAATDPPELALVDIKLHGGASGLEVARTLRDRHGTTCIFLTAQPELALGARDCALGVITKPYDSDMLIATIALVEATRTGEEPPAAPCGLELLTPLRGSQNQPGEGPRDAARGGRGMPGAGAG